MLVKCNSCSKDINRYPSLIHNLNFCNRQCRYDYQKVHLIGKNNLNYGKKWSEDLRKQQSERQSALMKSSEQRHLCGNANRGKKLSPEHVYKMHKNRTKESYSRPMKEETKIKVGLGSSKKFTNDYLNKWRKVMEDNGHWTKQEELKAINLYKRRSNWTSKKKVYFPISQEYIELIAKFGLMNKNNPNGMVRDHKFSRVDGYFNNVFPEILRHPANIQIISNIENIKKGSSSIISLEELFTSIKTFKESWHEQDLCVKSIIKYEKGERYSV